MKPTRLSGLRKLLVWLALLLPLLAFAADQPLNAHNPQVQAVMQLQDAMTPDLTTLPGILGTATGHNENGQLAVIVYVNQQDSLAPDIVRAMPPSARGTPIVVRLTDPFVALKGPPPGKKPGGSTTYTTTDVWPRPVPIGVSTSGYDGQCLAGTIACRVKDAGGKLYALSNNHVYALENDGHTGVTAVVQPGTYDTGCFFYETNVIGTLSAFEPINFDGDSTNFVDAAIAICSAGTLSNATPADGYGVPKSISGDPEVGEAVQKYGRTTQLTKGTITAINAATYVAYDSGTAYFEDQIIVESKKSFIKAGDSGSLLVTTEDNTPVGLLFAGDQTGKLAIANNINIVLANFGVAVDGSE